MTNYDLLFNIVLSVLLFPLFALIHEIGHIIAATIFGLKVRNLKVNWNRSSVEIRGEVEIWKLLFVMFAGVIANSLVILFFLNSGKLAFVPVNLFLIMHCLLPTESSDGAIIISLLKETYSAKSIMLQKKL